MNLIANEVHVGEDEYQVGITFVWPDSRLGWDCIRIERDWATTDERPPPIWVGRRMPLYSGHAGFNKLELHFDHIEMMFTSDLAEQVQLPLETSIAFTPSPEKFQSLRTAFERIFEGCTCFSVKGAGLLTKLRNHNEAKVAP